MAAVNLPDNPANGTTQTVGGITYTYNSSKGYWTAAASSGGGGGGGASVTTSDSAPSSPSDGDLWYDTDDGGMFVYYADGTSNQWVEVIGTQGAQGTLTTSDSAPSSPSDGDLWYDTDDGGLFIYYADGTSSQWVEVVGQQGAQGPAGPAGAAGSTTVVANTTALLAISSPSAGDMAYVSGNNTLYFYNGSGWYKIALINTTPSISGVSASYALAVDGTATTVTLVASDPEGLPITYSIASDTSGNIATVTQGTGSSTNVFTITPSTNTAHAGTFSLTFRASDGVNFATAASSFTLTFVVQNSKYTTALITSVGANNAVNNTFDDKSTNNHTITAAGDVHQTTFSPYRHAGYSAYFDGTGDKLTVADNADFNFGSGNSTLEMWVYPTDVSGTRNLITRGTSGYSGFILSHSGFLESLSGSSWDVNITFSSALTANSWQHIAVVRDGNTWTVYKDGTSVGTGTATGTVTSASQTLTIGERAGQSNFAGYMTDLRIVKGTAVYTSNFTAPTERLTAVTNTSLLACHLPYIGDGSTNGHSITVSGDTSIKPFAPYNITQEYAASSHSGSVHFDGTGDYIDITPSAANLGTGDFTVECWVYFSADPRQIIYDTRQSDGNSGHAIFMTSSTHYIVFYDNNATVLTSAQSVKQNHWNHIAVVRNSGTLNIFLNGKKDTAQATGNTTNFDAHTFRIGQKTYGGLPNTTGNITDFRISSSARYSTDFTPSTAPFTSDSYTSLLIQGTDAGIIDKSQAQNEVSLYGNVSSSTAAYKYLSSSMYFDGTGDYIQLGGMDDRFYGDFTVEMWVKFNTYNSGSGVPNSRIFVSRQGGNHPDNLQLIIDYTGTNGSIDVWTNIYHITDGTTNIADNNWHHVAVSRQGTSMKLFIDGTQEGSTATTSQSFLFWDTRLGARDNTADAGTKYTGYISDVRITKGLARYTSNFTAPTAALQG